jgi:hypothetical protein
VFFLKGKFWIFATKVMLLVFIGGMLIIQIPELRYDFGPREPVVVSGPEGLAPERFPRATFVSIKGRPDFERAFVYRRYGLSYTYFNIVPYGMRLVVRTYDPVTEKWRNLNRFLGKLRPFRRQPFHYRIRDIYLDKFDVEVPEGAFFLALGDAPRASGWQIAAVVFAAILWMVLFYVFFIFRRKRRA